MELLKQLNTLSKKINRAHPDINEGGCCVFAVMVAKELIKRKIRTKIIVAGYDPEHNIQDVRMKVKDTGSYREWHQHDIYFAHVGVEFVYQGKTYHYDTAGVHDVADTLGRWDIYQGRMRISWAARIADRPEAWNHCFDRGAIPEIEAKVKEHINGI